MLTKKPFREGDAVKLKSGGPRMTLETKRNWDIETWACVWFTLDGQIHCTDLSATSLVEEAADDLEVDD